MSSTIFNGNTIKALLPALSLGSQATIWSGTVDPMVTPTAGTVGDVYIQTGSNPGVYQKIITSATDSLFTECFSIK